MAKAKGKAVDKEPKTQKSITSFLTKPPKAANSEKPSKAPKPKPKPSKKRDDENDGDVEEEFEDEEEDDDDVDADVDASAKKTGRAAILSPDESDLAPMNSIPAMFSDLVSRIPEIKDVAQHVNGRKLRVATMCSGTESPLLALELIQKSLLDQHQINFDIEHVFSCEIEPFKQAYIERNFHPPLLFRDVCELGDDEAHTAYGALAPVPGNVDLLVAGTSCVDYSNLNNQKKGIDAKGESGQTFHGMLSWVRNHRPPIVILENVCSAPWPKVQGYFEAEGYSADFTRVDTKQFYIPHTRTRVYLVAIDKKNSDMPTEWKDIVLNRLKRPASSTLDAFLLPSDDPRIHLGHQKQVQEISTHGRIDWARCESRHQRARLEEELGNKRPLSSWDEGGSCKMPDFAWNDWGKRQVERVWDLLDISLLRSAKKGIDPSYKTQVWNLSQNVDRTIGSNRVGISPCLTPSMIPYITNRGGPMTGLEALSLQGLPIDKLLLTKETEDQLADLAGNAMSTTVVGACILAALVCGKKLLKKGNDTQTYEAKRGLFEAEDEDSMDVDKPAEVISIDEHIIGENALFERDLSLAALTTRSLSDVLMDAERSARLCLCEGRSEMTSRKLFRCQDCDTPFCKACGGRPEHNPLPIDLKSNPRLPPSDFLKVLKAVLPMSIAFSGITKSALDEARETSGVTIPDSRWNMWRDATLRAGNSDLRFVEPKRQDIWSVVYESPHGVLELFLHPRQPEWRLFAKPLESEPANAEIRQLLETPIGRLTCQTDLLNGRWEFALPHTASVDVTIEGIGELVPSWETRLGLMEQQFKEKKIYPQLKVSVKEEDVHVLDRDVSGVYTLLDQCGTANGALHKRIVDNETLPPLLFFLDPHRTNNTKDSFVFSISSRRLEFGEVRPIVAKLDASWRQNSEQGQQTVSCQVLCKWIASDDVQLNATKVEGAKFSVPGDTLELDLSDDSCRSATALLTCSVPLDKEAGAAWGNDSWREIDKVHERSTFKMLAWVLERVRDVRDDASSWQDVQLDEIPCQCHRCAPKPPDAERWARADKGKKPVPVEDPVQAGEYERRLKSRPTPFVTQVRVTADGVGVVRIGANVTSLLHRALSRLPTVGRTEKPTLSWKLNTNFTPSVRLELPKFVLTSNKQDKEHSQPPSFKLDLRPEQLRSLEWMIKQESKKAPPFIEEEISEGVFDSLGWRAEGRAQRAIHIRGGVLADQVGYGKTAITLALTDCTAKAVEKEFNAMDRIPGKIAIQGTLIVVPPHLTQQWKSEVAKFMKKGKTVLKLETVATLNSATIKDFMEADYIFVASNMFKSGVYLDNLQAFAAAAALPKAEGRNFDAVVDKILPALGEQVDRLQDEGSLAVMAKVVEFENKLQEEEEAGPFVPTKRLKGRSYAEAAAKKAQAKATTARKTIPLKSGPRPRGDIVEVVIPRRASSSTAAASSPSTSAVPSVPSSPAALPSSPSVIPSSPSATGESSSDERRPRRTTARKSIIISDDEDEEMEDVPKKSKSKILKKKTNGKGKHGSSSDNDFTEMSSSEASEDFDDDNESFAMSDDEEEEETTRGKKKPAAKPTAKPKPSAATKRKSNDTSDDDAMAVDTDASVASKKRKAQSEPKRPAKKMKRSTADPWKLESKPVKKDWEQMKAPLFEMFHYSRVVVDEYTYLTGIPHTLITRLTSSRRWVLSGTPPIHDFAALKTIAAFLDVHLGIDDGGETAAIAVQRRRFTEQSAVERFHSFREVHTPEWHMSRHQVGQRFLDQFVRQNMAEIDEIPWTDKTIEIELPAAERAIYLELEHYLRNLDMTMKRSKKEQSDRERRLNKALGESKSAEEALLKRCSHFEVDIASDVDDESDEENDEDDEASDDEDDKKKKKPTKKGKKDEKKKHQEHRDPMKACDIIVRERQKQLDECKSDLLKVVQDGWEREQALKSVPRDTLYSEWVRICRSEDGVEDTEASTYLREILDEAGVGHIKPKGKKDETKLAPKINDMVWEHREKTHEIRRIAKEMVGRVRSLRYFMAVRDLQKQRDTPPKVDCPNCGRTDLPIADVAVLSSCGHMGCLSCVRTCAEAEECVYAASRQCRSAARVINIVNADTLGVDDEDRDRGRYFGMKLHRVVQLIKKSIPADERVLVFVQFPDLMDRVEEAFTYNKIEFRNIKGTASQKSSSLTAFQNNSKERVLLLNVMDESASGANLTSANHAIFLSPLLAPSKEIYTACETQAVGRLVRYGQKEHVHVYRFVTKNTIDETIYAEHQKDLVEMEEED